MEQKKTKRKGKPPGFNGKISENYKVTISISNADDPTNTTLTTTYTGNYDGLIHAFKSFLSSAYHNYFQNSFVKQSTFKYKQLLIPTYLFRATNKTILQRKSHLRSSLLDKGILSILQLTHTTINEEFTQIELFNQLTQEGKQTCISLVNEGMIAPTPELLQAIEEFKKK